MTIRRVAHPVLASCLLAGSTLIFVLGPASPAWANCSETTKFVYQGAINPATGNSDFFGTRGVSYAYNYEPICSGGAVANSFFMRLSPDYLNFVETGPRQQAGDPGNRGHAWAEWHYYPAPIQVHNYDSIFTLYTGNYFASMLSNGPGTSWDIYIKESTTPNTTYHHLANTGNLAAFAGLPESEFSRYGAATEQNLIYSLQDQHVYLGSWYTWQALYCDRSQDSITDSRVERPDSSEWYLVPPAAANTTC